MAGHSHASVDGLALKTPTNVCCACLSAICRHHRVTCSAQTGLYRTYRTTQLSYFIFWERNLSFNSQVAYHKFLIWVLTVFLNSVLNLRLFLRWLQCFVFISGSLVSVCRFVRYTSWGKGIFFTQSNSIYGSQLQIKLN